MNCNYLFEKKFAEHPNVKKADESYIRVMSSNVLHTHDGYSRQLANLQQIPYHERAEYLAKLYLAFEPDFLGLQEVSYEMEPILFDLLKDVYDTPHSALGDAVNYAYHGTAHTQNHTPILYNKHKYDVIDSRFHNFEAGGLWSYEWAVYALKSDPTQTIAHMNLHYPSSSAKQYFGAAVDDVHEELVSLRRMYREWIDPAVRQFRELPIIVTGDYNCRYTSEHFENMVKDLPMTSGMLVAEDGQPDEKIIDHETVTTDALEVKLHRSLWWRGSDKLSDHPQTFVDVVLKKQEIKYE